MRVSSYCEELPASPRFLLPVPPVLMSVSLTLAFLHLPSFQKDTSDARTTRSCRPFPISGPLTQKVARSRLLGPEMDVSPASVLSVWTYTETVISDLVCVILSVYFSALCFCVSPHSRLETDVPLRRAHQCPRAGVGLSSARRDMFVCPRYQCFS